VVYPPFPPDFNQAVGPTTPLPSTGSGQAAPLRAGGIALLDILPPCITFNRRNTWAWYRERCKPFADSHDPRNKMKALELAMPWDGGIPIGLFYTCDRPTFESQQPVLRNGTLVEAFVAAEHPHENL